MSIIRWEPISDITLREAMGRLFEDSFVSRAGVWPDGHREVPIEIYETDDNLVVKAALPGVKPEEVDITLTGDTLTIKGEHKEEKERKEAKYLYREMRQGSFSRSITLPLETDSDKAAATFENGILIVTLPKAEELKPHNIKIKVGSPEGPPKIEKK